MANMLDYLDWRGDLSLAAAPFNDVDGLLLSSLSYAALEGIVPGPGEGSISLRSAAKKFHEKFSPKELAKDRSFTNFAPKILDKLAGSARFGNASLKNFAGRIDTEQEVQFAAMEIVTSDHIPFLSFRGTDDTLIGWKEDFNLSYMTTPSEIMSAEYLKTNRAHRRGRFRVGGHSKGGHLAVYAAAAFPPAVRRNILAIYDNDGPGYNEAFTESGPDYTDLLPLIHRTLPEDSVIGMLMHSLTEPVFCASSARGLMQHDPTTWQVLGDGFVTRDRLGHFGQLMEEALDRWLQSVDDQERRQFVNDLFNVLDATGSKELSHIRDMELSDVTNVWKAIEKTSRGTRGIIEELFRILIEETRSDISENITESSARRMQQVKDRWKALKEGITDK